MNEDNQNEQQQNSDIGKQIGNQALNMGKQISQNSARVLGELAKEGAKALWAKVSVGIISILSAILPWIGVIIFFITVFLPSADYYLNIYINESVSEEAADILNQYCIIDETGVHFNKQEILVALKDAFKSGDIDFDSLGLGKDAFSLNGEEFSDEEFYNSEAANHLYNLMTATLSSELPYIEGSDKEAQGIIKIKRQVEANGQAQNLKYIGIEAFNEMVENKDPNILNFFSLDETWNLWVAKPYEQINQYVKTINGSVAESNTNRDYNIIPVSIPYRTLISQYTMPFEFLMVLQTMTYSSKYVEAVSDLVTNSSQIDFTIFDSTSVTTNVYTVEYDQHAKGVNHIEGNPNSSIPSEQTGRDVPWRTDEHIVETTTVTTTEEAPILANVTKAKTWLIDQITQYEAEEKIGEVTVDTKTGPYSQEDPGDDVESASWYTDKMEYTKETIDSTNWKKAADSITKLHPDEFLGLWKNDTGTYVKGASYNPNGNVVNYNIENEEHKDRPIMNILSAEEEFYGHLEENVKTQIHAEMMREIIDFYNSRQELQNSNQFFDSDLLKVFNPNEFIEMDITIGASTVKEFIHYFEGKPKESNGKYVVFDDGAGTPTVGWGINISAHTGRFLARGINPRILKIGDLVDKAIVDSIEDEIIEEFRSNVIKITAGLNLADYQIDALTSRYYNCGPGGMKGFVTAYKQYGNTQALYDNFLKNPVTSKGKYMPGLKTRREAEWRLFHEGYYANTNSYGNQTSSNPNAGLILQKAKECHDYVRTNNFIYEQAGVNIPINSSSRKTIDCSSFVSWVLYESGYSQFAGDQKNSSYFASNPMNWQKISRDNLQAGDIMVFSGHVQIYAGGNQYYNCGGNSSIRTPAPSSSGTSINSGTFLFGLRPN